MMLACVCDRCAKPYGVPAALWPGKSLCPHCDLATPVWERNRYTKDQARAA